MGLGYGLGGLEENHYTITLRNAQIGSIKQETTEDPSNPVFTHTAFEEAAPYYDKIKVTWEGTENEAMDTWSGR